MLESGLFFNRLNYFIFLLPFRLFVFFQFLLQQTIRVENSSSIKHGMRIKRISHRLIFSWKLFLPSWISTCSITLRLFLNVAFQYLNSLFIFFLLGENLRNKFRIFLSELLNNCFQINRVLTLKSSGKLALSPRFLWTQSLNILSDTFRLFFVQLVKLKSCFSIEEGILSLEKLLFYLRKRVVILWIVGKWRLLVFLWVWPWMLNCQFLALNFIINHIYHLFISSSIPWVFKFLNLELFSHDLKITTVFIILLAFVYSRGILILKNLVEKKLTRTTWPYSSLWCNQLFNFLHFTSSSSLRKSKLWIYLNIRI